jgi:hypothetical protein
MTQPADAYKVDAQLEPLCPRDNNTMRYEASGLPSGTDNRPSYHCGHGGCNVRYDLVNGYFTLIGMPESINPLAEPGVNFLSARNTGLGCTAGEIRMGNRAPHGVAVSKDATTALRGAQRGVGSGHGKVSRNAALIFMLRNQLLRLKSQWKLAARAASKRSNCKGPLGPPCAVTP